jgi:hypothetical protein
MHSLARPNRAISGLISLAFLILLSTHSGTKLYLDATSWGGKVIGHAFVQSLHHLPLVGQSGSTTH